MEKFLKEELEKIKKEMGTDKWVIYPPIFPNDDDIIKSIIKVLREHPYYINKWN